MPNMPSVGVIAVVQGAAQYTQDINKVAADTQTAAGKINSAAGSGNAFSTALGAINKAVSQFIPQLNGITSGAQATTEGMSGLTEAFGASAEILGPLAIGIGVATAALGAFLDLAERGAGFADITHAFDNLAKSAGTTADVLVGQLHDASQGTIDDQQLMTVANQALLGVNADLQKSFGQDLPQMMSIARSAALATRRDTTQVFDSITEAVKRGQTRGLQAIGIIVDQKKAYEDYALSVDKSVKSLTKADQEQALLNATLKAGKQVQDELGGTIESNATKMDQANTTITNSIDKLATAVQPAFSAILDVLNNVLDGIGAFVDAIAPYVQVIAGIVGDGIKAIFGIADSTNTSLQSVGKYIGTAAQVIKAQVSAFFDGGANLIGALAAGIMNAANTVVFPAIISIATFIADFLSGLSPPPKGPLHNIDQGAANIMTAWVQGFTGVSLDPVAQVAQNVAGIMGGVANESMDQVKDRLFELDQAIEPFQEQLDLVKGQFTAIDNVTKPALDSINRQINLATEALNKGDQAAAETIKTLEAQKQALTDYNDQQQIGVDNAQIQLALAQAQQGTERAILTTRENQLTLEAKFADKTVAAKAAPKAKKGGGGGASATDPTGGALTPGTPASDQANADATAAGQGLSDAFQAGFVGASGGAGGVMGAAGAVASNISALSAQTARIGTAASDLPAKIMSSITTPFTNASKNITALFDPGNPDSIPAKITSFVNSIPGAFAGLATNLQTHLVGTISTAVSAAVMYFNPGGKGGIFEAIKTLATTGITNALDSLAGSIETSLVTPFSLKVAEIAANFTAFFDTPGAGLHKVFDNVMNFLGTLPAQVGTAFKGFAQGLLDSFINPMVAAMNGTMDAIASFINGTIVPAVKNLVIAADAVSSILGHPINVTVPGAIAFAHVPPVVLGAADGGMFTKGLLQTHANELIAPAEKIGVFPSSFVDALNRLTEVLIRTTTASGGAINTNNNSTVQNINFNGVRGTEDAKMRFSTLQALRPR